LLFGRIRPPLSHAQGPPQNGKEAGPPLGPIFFPHQTFLAPGSKGERVSPRETAFAPAKPGPQSTSATISAGSAGNPKGSHPAWEPRHLQQGIPCLLTVNRRGWPKAEVKRSNLKKSGVRVVKKIVSSRWGVPKVNGGPAPARRFHRASGHPAVVSGACPWPQAP